MRPIVDSGKSLPAFRVLYRRFAPEYVVGKKECKERRNNNNVLVIIFWQEEEGENLDSLPPPYPIPSHKLNYKRGVSFVHPNVSLIVGACLLHRMVCTSLVLILG